MLKGALKALTVVGCEGLGLRVYDVNSACADNSGWTLAAVFLFLLVSLFWLSLLLL